MSNFLSALVTILFAVLLYPLAFLICKLLRLDSEDTEIMLYVCMPTSVFLVVLAFCGGVF